VKKLPRDDEIIERTIAMLEADDAESEREDSMRRWDEVLPVPLPRLIRTFLLLPAKRAREES